MMGGRFPQSAADVGQAVASFPTYEAAQRAVSALIAAEIPARDIAIVGFGLRSIEKVTGKLGYATAARSGAVNGLLIGLLFSAIFVLGQPAVQVQAFIGVMFVGIAIGMLFSIIIYTVVRRRRDFASVMQVVADRYDVSVAAQSVPRARQALGPRVVPDPPATAPAGPPAIPDTRDAPEPVPESRPAPSGEPPRYGERIVPTPADDDEQGPESAER